MGRIKLIGGIKNSGPILIKEIRHEAIIRDRGGEDNMAKKEKEGETVQDPKKEGRPAPSIEKNTGGGTSGSIQGGAGNAPGESGGQSS